MKLLSGSFTRKIIPIIFACIPATATATFAKPVEVAVNDRPPVALVLLDKLMSGHNQVGDVVHYETLANVDTNDGRILIPAGSPAFGAVTLSKGSGMFGKRGQLQFTCEYVVLPNGNHVPLSGNDVSKAGANDLGPVAAVSLLVSPLGLLIKGGTVEIDRGTPITMYVASGARITPTKRLPKGVLADFTMRDKHTPDTVGWVAGFDGSMYTVRAYDGHLTTVASADVRMIEIEPPP